MAVARIKDGKWVTTNGKCAYCKKHIYPNDSTVTSTYDHKTRHEDCDTRWANKRNGG